MNAISKSETNALATDSFKVNNIYGGKQLHSVSSQWYSRPDDQRFLSLNELADFTKQRRERSLVDVIDVRDIRLQARMDDPNSLRVSLPSHKHGDVEAAPTHWSFGQLASLLSAPAGYLRRLPAPIAAINLQYAVSNFRSEAIKTFIGDNGDVGELRAATGPEYGRVFDHEIVTAVQRLAGNGTGDTQWKIPGTMNWGSMMYNPHHPVSKDTTTLFASDRDLFMFLCDDTHPIEIGRLPNGDPDLVFRGFMVWNSEVGSRSLGISTMYLRSICCNRILWGVEGYEEITLRHSKNAPMRLDSEIRPALESYANASTSKLLTGINTARSAIVARNDEERVGFLNARGLTAGHAKSSIEGVVREEGRAPESIWDFVQGITAAARSIGQQDARVTMEKRAGSLLNKVAKAS